MLITGSLPFAYITKDGSLETFSTVAQGDFYSVSYGDYIAQTYPYDTGISSDYYIAGNLDINGNRKRRLLSLKNTLNSYSYLSPHYHFSSDLGNKETQQLRLLSIPSIFYGQSIKKGTVSLKFYVTGTLIGELQDSRRNGELIQVGPSGSLGSGSTAGVVLYNEGFIVLTGSWDIDNSHTEQYIPDDATYVSPAWIHFMTTGSAPDNLVPSSSFAIDFEGTEKIPTVTMFAKAGRGELNHSNNQTYIEYGQNQTPYSSSMSFSENDNLDIKNIVTVNYDEVDPPFEKITYVSKIAIYDKDKNLIGIAKLANPVKKTQNDNITFKLKLDF